MIASVNGTRLAYDDRGRGPAVVLLHGFPLCRRMWEPQAAALSEAGYRVVTPDLRGFGDSAPSTGPCSMALYADDVAALMERLGIGRAALGGMSMGGYVLLELLARHPRRAAAAMFLVTRAGADDAAGRERRSALAAEVEAGHPEAVATAFEQVLFAPGTPRQNPALVAQVRQWMAEADPRGLVDGLLAMAERRDFRGELHHFTLPALVVGAAEDRAVPGENARELAAGLPRATLEILAGGGHMVNLERPALFNACLLDFLARLCQ